MAMVIPVLTMHGAVAPLAVALLAASAAVQDSPRERPASLTPDVIEVAVVKRDLFVVDSRGARDPIRLFMDERVLNTVAQGRVAAVLTSQRALFFADGNLEVAEARWKMNERAAREAVLGGEVGVIDSPAIVSWKWPGNRFGSLEVVYSPEMIVDTNHYAQDDRIEITGTRGVIWITRGHGKMMDVPPVVMYKDMKTYTYSDMPVGWEHSFINSTRQFIDSFFKGEPPSLTGEQGRDILRFALAAQESSREGRSVRV